MTIEHNHSELEISYAIADNCPKCRLNLYAEELLIAAEAVWKWKDVTKPDTVMAADNLLKVIDKIRGKNA